VLSDGGALPFGRWLRKGVAPWPEIMRHLKRQVFRCDTKKWRILSTPHILSWRRRGSAFGESLPQREHTDDGAVCWLRK